MTTTKQTDANGNILTNTAAASGVLGLEVLELPASYADFALAAGCAHDASKGDVLAAMGKAKADLAKFLDVVGAKSIDDAIGKITGERASHGTLIQAIVGDDEKNPTAESALKKLSTDRQQAERVEAEKLLEEAKAQGKTAGDKAMGIFNEHGMGAFRSHLAALTPNQALVAKGPTPKSAVKDPAQPSSAAKSVKLTKDDRKLMKAHGWTEEQFIEARRAEIGATDDSSDEDDSDDE